MKRFIYNNHKVGSPSLYTFTNYTFTNAGITGRYGPTLSNCQTAYAGTTWITSYFTMSTQGYQVWTIPQTGTYEIETAGSRAGYVSGMESYAATGQGAIVRGRFSLTGGLTLILIVGQYEDSANSASISSYFGLGGGGGSFVSYSSNLLIAAGGGGGGSNYSSTLYAGQNGQTTTSGGNGVYGNGVGGSGGNGGGTATLGQQYWGGCGAGWSTDGQNGNGSTTHPSGQISYFGEGGYTYSGGFYGGDYNYAWGNPTAYASTRGGFGGGGGGNGILGGGAGGGYSGGGVGGSGIYSDSAGGGGSYILSSASSVATSNGQYAGSSTFNGNSITNLSTYNNAIGYIKITKL